MKDNRKWWLLIGAVVLFLVLFQLLEDRFTTSPPDSAARDVEPSIHVPEVRRLDDGAVEIRHDLFRRTTIRMGDEDQEQALFECLEQEIEQTFGAGTEDWSRRRVRNETQRILDGCMGSANPMPLRPLANPGKRRSE